MRPGERAAFLDSACGGDSALRAAVERLLDDGGPSLELAPGESLAQYRIEKKLGQGGMGAVYLAHDTRLNRKAAVKVLTTEHAANEQYRRRLLREARAAAALNHPNIVTVYETASDRGVDFIAMEFVAGHRLDELIPKKGLAQKQLLKYAIQIADGLACLHQAGLLHRDLKPANIMIDAGGRARILDFGLAKDVPATGPSAETSTATVITQAGIVVGTTAYLSPEQAEGRDLDARSDVFSFGIVLYQMATGHLPFDADSRVALLAKILKEDPEPPRAIASISPELERLILRCLRKDPSRRYQTMADLRVALEDLELESTAGVPAPPPASSRFNARTAALAALALVALVAIGFLAAKVWPGAPQGAALRTIKFTINPANLVRGADGQIDTEISVSHNGKHIAYVENQGGQLWIRDIDQESARPVPGATQVYQAFWSPDDRFIGYSSGANCGTSAGCDLMRIPVEGGVAVSLLKLARPFRRANWSSDGQTIVFCDTAGMYTVPARGGPVTPIVEHSHIEHPSFLDLPGGKRAVLYQSVEPGQRVHGLCVRVLGEDKFRAILATNSNNPYPTYSPTGHIIYVDGDRDRAAIWALPFSLSRLEAVGKPFLVAQQGASPVVSRTGTLIYGDVPPDRHQLAWVDRAGAPLALIGEPRRQLGPTLSPAAGRLSVMVMEDAPEMWVHDLARGTANPLTADGVRKRPGPWMAAGRDVVYAATASGRNFDIFARGPGASGNAPALVATPQDETPLDWSESRRTLLYETSSPESKGDLLYREATPGGGLGESMVFLKTPFDERAAQFSPDGKYVVHVSDESGRAEVYVRDFPAGTRKWQISRGGGAAPRWRRDGILFVRKPALVSVAVSFQPEFTPGPPAELFQRRALTLFNFILGSQSLSYPQYDVTPDGKKIVLLERPANEKPLSIHVAHNWFEEFRGDRKDPI